MTARNGEHGYGWVTKSLHWATVVVLVAQFVVGWTMSDDAYDARADALEQRWENRVEIAEGATEWAEEAREDELERRLEALEDREDDYVTAAFEDVVSLRFLEEGLTSAEVHVLLGLLLLALGATRVLWRRFTPLPPWALHLSEGERALEGRLEKAMLVILLVVPGTGLLLVLGEEDWLPLHVTAQVLLLSVVALHVGLVLRHTVVRRHRHLDRML
jgi:cytochrome b561